jgi:hypothetical protein
MSVVIRCDWCGEEVPNHAPHMTFAATATGNPDATTHDTGWVGHYHAGTWTDSTGRPAAKYCFRQMLDAVHLVHEYAPAALESAPVATSQKIAQLRRKHRPATDRNAT